MSMSAFNRMRRERKPVEKIEAQRFKNWNAIHNGQALENDESREADAELVRQSDEEQAAAVVRIGEKVVQGMKSKVIDEPLRRDHAAEISGRNLYNVQEPKDPVERIDERIPDSTENEKLAAHTQVDQPGPSKRLLAAAREEAGVVLPAAAGTAEERTAPSGEGADEGSTDMMASGQEDRAQRLTADDDPAKSKAKAKSKTRSKGGADKEQAKAAKEQAKAAKEQAKAAKEQTKAAKSQARGSGPKKSRSRRRAKSA